MFSFLGGALRAKFLGGFLKSRFGAGFLLTGGLMVYPWYRIIS